MKLVGLISGGKDSLFNMYKCVENGHEFVCVANICPPNGVEAKVKGSTSTSSSTLLDQCVNANEKDSSSEEKSFKELDSFMYQTAGYEIVPAIARCLQLPLIRQETSGKAFQQGLRYDHKKVLSTTNEETEPKEELDLMTKEHDEVEDLYLLLKKVKEAFPDVQGVASGALFSNYQRHRVEDVCARLGLQSFCFLWQRAQAPLLSEMLESGMEIILCKVASMGLKAQRHLGLGLAQLQPYLLSLEKKFGFHVCGEGGEYESLVLDCPLFKKEKLTIVKSDKIDLDGCGDSGILVIREFAFTPKESLLHGSEEEIEKQTNNAKSQEQQITAVVENQTSHFEKIPSPLSTVIKGAIENGITKAKKEFRSIGVTLCASNVSVTPNENEQKIFVQYRDNNSINNSSSDGTVDMSLNVINSSISTVNNKNPYETLATQAAYEATLALLAIAQRLKACNCDLADVYFVHLYIAPPLVTSSSFSTKYNNCSHLQLSGFLFSCVNQAYCRFFHQNPPSRVCHDISHPVSSDAPRIPLVKLDCAVLRGSGARVGKGAGKTIGSGNQGDVTSSESNLDKTDKNINDVVVIDRDVLHVKSRSSWAPVCIGPYSQGNVINPWVFPAGQIGLDPASMQLVKKFIPANDVAINQVQADTSSTTNDMSSTTNGMSSSYVGIANELLQSLRNLSRTLTALHCGNDLQRIFSLYVYIDENIYEDTATFSNFIKDIVHKSRRTRILHDQSYEYTMDDEEENSDDGGFGFDNSEGQDEQRQIITSDSSSFFLPPLFAIVPVPSLPKGSLVELESVGLLQGAGEWDVTEIEKTNNASPAFNVFKKTVRVKGQPDCFTILQTEGLKVDTMTSVQIQQNVWETLALCVDSSKRIREGRIFAKSDWFLSEILLKTEKLKDLATVPLGRKANNEIIIVYTNMD
eukprot:g2444.t1